MDNKPTIKEVIGAKIKGIIPAFIPKKNNSDITPPAAPGRPDRENTDDLKPIPAPTALIDEEKVEVLIKESIMIHPRDFSAFKHALEQFVADWDK